MEGQNKTKKGGKDVNFEKPAASHVFCVFRVFQDQVKCAQQNHFGIAEQETVKVLDFS